MANTKMTKMMKANMTNTNIKGLGTDIIEVERILKSITDHKDRFLNRLFTDSEIAYCQKSKTPERHFAGRFAAKEAVAKAFGFGIGEELGWKDIEITKDERGKPIVLLSESIRKKFKNPNILISISHCKKYANAIAIWT